MLPKFKHVIDGYAYNSETSEIIAEVPDRLGGPKPAYMLKSKAGAYVYCSVDLDYPRIDWELLELEPAEICELLQDANLTHLPIYDEMFAKVPEIGSKE
jgi:hypothetical protein